jgi:glycosyltransferase involved in cell wall biosynthesis
MKVSIVTPSFNQGQFIERTLESVCSQKDSLPADVDFEYVVYDGGSTDNTKDVLQKFTSKVTWVSELDNGQAHAVNKGLMHTDGDIIGWLNSDDVYYPNAIKKVVDFFNANPKIDVVYGMAEHIDVDDKAFEAYPTEPWSFGRLKETCFICQPALFFRRSVLTRSGLLDESLMYCMDYEFWIRLACSGAKFGYLKEILAGSRLYEDNKTLSSRVEVHREINDMFKNHLAYVPKRSIINYAYALVNEDIVKSKEPYKFAYRIFKESIAAARAWNGGLIRFFLQASLHWSTALLLGKFRMWRKTP